jgi:hypothetical protein
MIIKFNNYIKEDLDTHYGVKFNVFFEFVCNNELNNTSNDVSNIIFKFNLENNKNREDDYSTEQWLYDKIINLVNKIFDTSYTMKDINNNDNFKINTKQFLFINYKTYDIADFNYFNKEHTYTNADQIYKALDFDRNNYYLDFYDKSIYGLEKLLNDISYENELKNKTYDEFVDNEIKKSENNINNVLLQYLIKYKCTKEIFNKYKYIFDASNFDLI